jgi:cytosine/adenosine deaminase-related metal-dependent hydrolase
MRFDDMLRRGVRLGIATDGTGSNDTQNMFEALRIAGIWHTVATAITRLASADVAGGDIR